VLIVPPKEKSIAGIQRIVPFAILLAQSPITCANRPRPPKKIAPRIFSKPQPEHFVSAGCTPQARPPVSQFFRLSHDGFSRACINKMPVPQLPMRPTYWITPGWNISSTQSPQWRLDVAVVFRKAHVVLFDIPALSAPPQISVTTWFITRRTEIGNIPHATTF